MMRIRWIYPGFLLICALWPERGLCASPEMVMWAGQVNRYSLEKGAYVEVVYYDEDNTSRFAKGYIRSVDEKGLTLSAFLGREIPYPRIIRLAVWDSRLKREVQESTPGALPDYWRCLGFAPGLVVHEDFSFPTMHFWVGSERVFKTGVGIDGEFGFGAPLFAFQYAVAMFSVGLSYHLLPDTDWTSGAPYVTVGHTVAVRDGIAHLWHVGFGIDLWKGRGRAFRVEVRDQVYGLGSSDMVHFPEIRFASVRW